MIVFVAGTDTGVGKSVVTGLLGRYILDRGYSVVTQKWVETGVREVRDSGYSSQLTAPYILKFPASPHLAARLERKRVAAGKIIKSVELLSKDFDFVVIEGTGGLLVPLNEKTLVIDVVKTLNLSVVLVAANRLGAINHTLLSLEALKSRGIRTLGVIFNNVLRNERREILIDNPRIVEKLSGVKVLGVLPRLGDARKLQKQFALIGTKIGRAHV